MDSGHLIETHKKCRLCLNCLLDGPMIAISDTLFYEQLQNVFKFDILCDKRLPNFVCEECRGVVSYIYSFIQQVQANQEQLLNQPQDEILHPVENIKVESLFDENLFEVEEQAICETATAQPEVKLEFVQPSSPTGTVDNEELINPVTSDEEDTDEIAEKGNRRCPIRRNKRYENGLREKTDKRDKLQVESLAKQVENDQIIKDFFTLECEICSTPLDNFGHLLDHYRDAHNTKGYVRCCDKQFFRRYILVDHISAHRGTIRCDICQKCYKTRRYLALHIAKSHSREEDRPFKCAKCHVSYPKQYLLRAHELLHVQEQCHICQKMLSNNQSLKVHIAQMHGGDGNQICATCGKVFRTKPAMERHIKEHLGIELVERLQCEYCQKWFNGKYNLKKHIRFLHKEEGQVFSCDLCQHVSPNSRALANHKQRIHVEEKYECEYCGKRFKRRPNLREHIASHTNVPLYSCEICKNRTFNSKANYFTHRKNQHPEEWEAQKRLRSEREMSKN
ncbi:transcription factor grauzone-like [Anopheles nili]|uniref:transcription factor grauzone-like n=1 Tax=Anopheles nili TaxID=185578 RepID=UPI00237B0C10|nr:transcription factor grauzone-like [Anopheles nili]